MSNILLRNIGRNYGSYDISIIGGGIVGLSVGRQLLLNNNKLKLCILDKEYQLAKHQSNNNSGVIHAGIYYERGSERAKLCVEGALKLYEYCDSHNIKYKKIGKLIVATHKDELERLHNIYNNGINNGVPLLTLINSNELNKLEPNISGISAILSRITGITDFRSIALSYANDIIKLGGTIITNFKLDKVENMTNNNTNIKLHSSEGATVTSNYIITCCGLYSDKVAKLFENKDNTIDNYDIPPIVPFRGSWIKIKSEYSNIISHNIYPVPNPNFPFLGTHLTPTINNNNNILIGPNAAFAFSREGYNLFNININELIESLKLHSLQSMIFKHYKFALNELACEIAPKSIALKQIQRYIPGLQWNHIQTYPIIKYFPLIQYPVTLSGVRAQALGNNAKLIHDFIFHNTCNNRVLHVLNAPSPAATSSLTIAKTIAQKAKHLFKL